MVARLCTRRRFHSGYLYMLLVSMYLGNGNRKSALRPDLVGTRYLLAVRSPDASVNIFGLGYHTMQAASTNNFDPNHARVLVVGPMASGKTTLVQSLCYGGTGGTAAAGVRSRPPPTIGCNVDVKVLLQ